MIKYTDTKTFQWGYELDRTLEEKIEGIKLLLDPDQPKPLYIPQTNTNAELKKLGKPALDVATDYIGAIFQHAMRKIEGKYPRSYLDLLDKQLVLSVPAIWSDKAKDQTLKVRKSCKPLVHILNFAARLRVMLASTLSHSSKNLRQLLCSHFIS